MSVRFLHLAGMVVAVLAKGCSARPFPANRIGDALAGSGTTFASDDDPEVVQGE